jgi:hypothetical protein
MAISKSTGMIAGMEQGALTSVMHYQVGGSISCILL